nr:hypothetical protein [Actinomadura sp. NAK00032]
MTEAAPITVACIDLAGTTVADGDTAETAFAEAIATLGIVSGTAAFERAAARFHDTRGESEIGVFRSLFDEPRAQAAHLAFERSYGQLIDRRGLVPVPGAGRRPAPPPLLRRPRLPAHRLRPHHAGPHHRRPRLVGPRRLDAVP